MRELPILMNAVMVRAILSGAKTQTRRAIKPQPHIDGSGNFCWKGSNYGQDTAGVPLARTLASQIPSARNGRVLCPFGKIGDRLWVRETWRGLVNIAPPGSYEYVVARYVPDQEHCLRIEYAATQADDSEPWRPSTNMPRWACRLVLEITDLRVERLRAISREDCIAEGPREPVAAHGARAWHVQFQRLWESTGGDWDSNPWVWVIEFKRVEVTGG